MMMMKLNGDNDDDEIECDDYHGDCDIVLGSSVFLNLERTPWGKFNFAKGGIERYDQKRSMHWIIN